MGAIHLIPIIFAIIFIMSFHGTEVLGCYTASNSFIYAYHWKQRDKPLYDGNSATELIALCPNGCGSDCPIEDCDESAILSLQEAQTEVRGYQKFYKNVLIFLIVRSIPVIIIFVLLVYLIYKKHYRYRDLFYRTVETQWQTDEDPTYGVETHIWANMKVTAEDTENYKGKPIKLKNYIVNPIRRGKTFWRFRKIMGLFYGRDRYYRTARAWNELKWQIKHMGHLGSTVLDSIKNDALAKPEEAETETEDKKTVEDKYDWKDDLTNERVTPALLSTIGVRSHKPIHHKKKKANSK